ncbi:UNVERIFIED_CONTAM: hypothetical protein Sradi_3820400 [Sesamum radiatum]|uniref:Retrotransposon gag domain-containing protein n=1 Tax=Sesamum radiatum TaxID=300843 RepID=A0AAW2Q0H0_SESRA
MIRSHGEELTPYDLEIERTFHHRKNNIERGENSGETDREEQLVIFELTMEVIGAVERPMMEYSFPTANERSPASSSPVLKQTTLKSSHQSFRSFGQLDRESLYDAWEQFKSMFRKCPHQELPVWRQVQTFYNGVTLANRAIIDAAAGDTIMKKLPSEAFNVIDEIATNLYSYGQERAEKTTAGTQY